VFHCSIAQSGHHEVDDPACGCGRQALRAPRLHTGVSPSQAGLPLRRTRLMARRLDVCTNAALTRRGCRRELDIWNGACTHVAMSWIYLQQTM
jgi:hypothetical protein